MLRRLLATLAAVAIATAFTVPSVTARADTGTGFAPPGQYYLALGDSLSFGYQASKLQSLVKSTGTADPTAFNTGYVDDFARMLRTIRPGIQTVNYGCPGETTSSFLVACTSYPFALHNAYSGSQMGAALSFLQAHPGQVNPITVDLGANDIEHLIVGCNGFSNLGCVAQGLPATFKTITTNMTQILGALRQAAPNAEIIVMQLYNPYAALDPTTNNFAVSLNNVLASVAGSFNARLADAFTPFNLASPQPQTICTLTFFCGPLQDIHASDAGYLVIAKQFWEASGYDSLTPGFMTSFNSSSPGYGEVYFGSGPGCLGLVEVATQDLHPGSTTHSVLVKGNDLPGTVGDNGVIPGATYWYEYVTVTAGGAIVDNNSGACYHTTVAGRA